MLAGGRGSRMRPLTDDCPKPLLPVGDRSLLQRQLNDLAALGATRVVVAAGYRAADLHSAFPDHRSPAGGPDGAPSRPEVRVVREARPLGTGGGLREALTEVRDADAVLVLNGDLLTGHDLAAQVRALQEADDEVLAVVHVREVADARPYGSVVLGPDDRVTAFVEKSDTPPARTINAGTYVVRPALRERIPDGAVSLEREVFPALAAEGRLHGHREDADFLDVGNPAALVRANQQVVRAGGAEALVLPGAQVHPDAVLTGGSVVHPGARVGAGARLDGAVVLPEAVIGTGCLVARSVIGLQAELGEDASVIDAALGTGVRIAPGAQVRDALLPDPVAAPGR